MCDTYCKKRAAEQRTYPSKKTKVSQIDEQATSSSEPNLPDGSERLQPCAGLELGCFDKCCSNTHSIL